MLANRRALIYERMCASCFATTNSDVFQESHFAYHYHYIYTISRSTLNFRNKVIAVFVLLNNDLDRNRSGNSKPLIMAM